MSCIFTSRNTRYPRSTSDTTASGPAAAHSSRPILATPNHGLSSSAHRVARTRSSISSASANRSRASIDGSSQFGDSMDLVVLAPAGELGEDAGGGSGSGEGGGADLHGRGARQQELDGIGAGGDAPDPDDRRVRMGHVAVVHGPDGDRVDGRPGQPSAAGAQPKAPRAGIDGPAHDRAADAETGR